MTDGPWTLIANPVAGGGRRSHQVEACCQRLRATGQEATIAWTSAPGQAWRLAAEAIDRGSTTVVACGGDGTVSEVLPAVAGRARLGLLPLGTCNDLARALRIPTAPKRAARLLLDGEARPIDLGRCEDRTFATVAAFGFDAEVSQSMMDGQVPLSGTAGYLYATVRQLRAYRPPRVRVTGDFGELQQPVFLAATANTPFYGGGMRIVPAADPTDGLLDLCLIDGDVSAATVMAMLPRIFWGGHVRHPAVRQLRSSFVELEALDGPRIVHADGEHLTESPAVLRVEPAAVHVIQPTETGSKASYSGPAQLDR